jgi:hypothetical protein
MAGAAEGGKYGGRRDWAQQQFRVEESQAR